MTENAKEKFWRCKCLFFKRIDRYLPWSHLRLTSAAGIKSLEVSSGWLDNTVYVIRYSPNFFSFFGND